MVRRLFLAVCLVLALPVMVQAAAPQGVWVYDRKALEAQGDRFGQMMARRVKVDVAKTRSDADGLIAQADALPPEESTKATALRQQAAQMRQLADDPATFFKIRFINGIAGETDNTLELAGAGKAISTADGKRETGSWKIEGKELVVTFKDATVRGSYSAKRLELRYAKVPEADATTMDFLKGFSWVMLPK